MCFPNLRFVFSAIAGLALTAGLFAQAPAPKLEFPAPSPAASFKQRVGITDITVAYSRPSVKDRVIFGGLVPFDKVWRTGANSATKITFSTDVKLNGTTVPAGNYELYTIPGKTEWTVIIHKDSSAWGAYSYDQKNDVARIKATPAALPTPVETFVIGISDLRDESAVLFLTWEKTRVPVKLEVDVKNTLPPQIEAVMASAEPKKPYAQAAMFYYEHNLDLKKAVTWMDAAIAAQPDAFYLVYRKALILKKQGDKAAALATAKASLDSATKSTSGAREEYIRLNNELIATLD